MSNRADRVPRALRRIAQQIHDEDVAGDALRSRLDGWAAGLLGAADILDGDELAKVCPETRFPDGTRCGEYDWHASDCPARADRMTP